MGPTPAAPPKPAEPTPPAATRSATASGGFDRRTLVLSAALLVGVIVIGLVAVSVLADPGPRKDTQGQAQDGADKPHIIPRPNEGHAPQGGGDRGGWEQLTLFGLMLASMAGIGVVIFRGGSKARANRAAWRAAGDSASDGAVDTVGTHVVAARSRPQADEPGGPEA